MDLYEVSLSMSMLGFVIGTMLANIHMCVIMLVLREVQEGICEKWSVCSHLR